MRSRLAGAVSRVRDRMSEPNNRALLNAGLTLLLLLLVWWHTGRWYQARLLEDQRVQLAAELTIHGTTLNSALDRYFTLLDGIAAFVHAEVHAADLFPVDEFEIVADSLYQGSSAIQSITVAPSGILRYVHPLEGNRHLLGVDLSDQGIPELSAGADKALEARRPNVCRVYQRQDRWQVDTCQPVFHNGDYWGMVLMTLNLPAILDEAGLLSPLLSGGVQAALRTAGGNLLYGDPTAFGPDGIIYYIHLPQNVVWEMGLAPSDEWYSPIQEATRLFRVGGFLIVVLIAGLVYLVDNRHARLSRDVLQRTQEISQINEGLERRAVERTRELSALYDVTSVASTSLDIDTIMTLSLEKVVDVSGVAMGVIQLTQTPRGAVYQSARPDLDHEERATVHEMLLGEDLLSRVHQEGKAVMFSDPTAAVDSEQRSLIAVPIRARGDLMGILAVAGRLSQKLKPEDLGLLSSIADQLASAVQNARLFRDAQGKATLEERQRLARELHDSVTQSLYSLALFAEAAQERAAAGEYEFVKQHLTRIGSSAQGALRDMRLLLYELRPSALEEDGLVGALRNRLKAVERRSGVEAHLVADPLIQVPRAVEEALYYIAQEALNNALKHAASPSVAVCLLEEKGDIELTVYDRGSGFDPVKKRDDGGMGLMTMSEWAERAGATLEILSSPGAGTTIRVRVKAERGDEEVLSEEFQVSEESRTEE